MSGGLTTSLFYRDRQIWYRRALAQPQAPRFSVPCRFWDPLSPVPLSLDFPWRGARGDSEARPTGGGGGRRRRRRRRRAGCPPRRCCSTAAAAGGRRIASQGLRTIDHGRSHRGCGGVWGRRRRRSWWRRQRWRCQVDHMKLITVRQEQTLNCWAAVNPGRRARPRSKERTQVRLEMHAVR